jgi:hypothetical protein
MLSLLHGSGSGAECKSASDQNPAEYCYHCGFLVQAM